MTVLALDTAAAKVSLALMDGDVTVIADERAMERGQGEALFPMIQALEMQTGLDLSTIDAVAVCVGPGSFTGVRIALAAARGIGLALNVPVWGVTSLEAAAFGANEPVIAVLDTKRGDYFVQSFDANGCATDEPTIATADELKCRLPFVAVGSAAEQLADEIGCAVKAPVCTVAEAVGRIAWTRRDAEALPPEPLYLRDADVTV